MAEPLGVPKPIGGDKKDVGGAFMRNPARQTPMGDKPKPRGGIGSAAKAIAKVVGMEPTRNAKPVVTRPIGDAKPIGGGFKSRPIGPPVSTGDGPKSKPSGEPKAKPIGDSKPPVKSGGDSKPKGDGGLIKPMPKSDAVAPPPSSDKKRK